METKELMWVRTEDSPIENMNLHSLVDCGAECYFLLSANVLNSFASCGCVKA